MLVGDTMEVAGVNDRAQLAVAEAELRDRINERWMRRGVTMWDPERTYIDVDVELEPDVVLLPGVILQGSCVIGAHAEMGPDVHLVDTVGGGGRGGGLQRLPALGHRRQRPRRARSPSSRRGPRSRRVRWSGPWTGDGCGRPRPDEARRRQAVASWAWNSPPAGASNWCRGGRTRAGPGRRRAAGRRPGRGQPPRVRQRRDPLPLRHVHPGERRLHHPDPLRSGERLADGAPDHDRRRQAGVGQADHRGLPLLRVLAPGPQGHRPRADHRQAGGRHAVGGRGRPGGQRRPALRADPGLLRRPLRPPDRRAGAGRLPADPAQRRPGGGGPRRRAGEGGRAVQPAPDRRPGRGPQAPAAGCRPTRSRRSTWSATSRVASAC